MRLRADQISNHVQQSALKPIYLISGDEPLQLLETADQIRRKAREEGYSERIVLEVDKQFNWQQVLDESATLSLFGDQKIIELKLGSSKPGRDGGKVLKEYTELNPQGIVLLITCDRLDKSAQSTKWFKAIDNAGVSILIWPIEITQLPNWIAQRMRTLGKKIDKNAAELIATRVEGNLIAANQEISKLILLVDSDHISVDDVSHSVVDSARYDVFNLIESAYDGNLERTTKMLQGLKSEGLDPMAIYGALMWEYRRLCKMIYELENKQSLDSLFSQYRIWTESRKRAIRSLIKRHDLESLQQLLLRAIKLDKTIKSSQRINAWNELLEFLTLISKNSKQINKTQYAL